MASSIASRQSHLPLRPAGGHVYLSSARTLVLGLSRVIFASLPASVSAAPASLYGALQSGVASSFAESEDGELEDGRLWGLYIASAVLVLLGGAFAGLTIALMGQDSIYLQVLSRDETDPQQRNAKRVYELLQRGKHWVLVTLLLSNVIVNETLPVVLDRCLGGGVAAVVGSTLLIVVFGEVLPQSICVRYGLQIGGVMSKPVLALMWLMAPIAWPTAKVLDHALGEDHGTVYKKSGLKTLVTLHRSLGEVSERLNQDEVTIISAVLDLKEKPVSNVMTPMDDVFTMSEDTVLDEETMDVILSAGYSRIPIFEPGNPTNFVGMLLVKMLITYDPDDKKRVSEFPLATLPETRPETSCLDIVNFFQEGKSHMVLVSQYPGEDHGAMGVVTLEDVIEELIGEEIIDESDVYIDVHKAIRRLQPAPRARPIRHRSLTGESAVLTSAEVASPPAVGNGGAMVIGAQQQPLADAQPLSSSPKATTFMMRRCSTDADGQRTLSTVPVRGNIDDMWQHLRHLGPSNRAANPKNTRLTSVKIKPGMAPSRPSNQGDRFEQVIVVDNEHHDEEDDVDETTQLLKPLASGSHVDLQNGYGTHSPVDESGAEHQSPVAESLLAPTALTVEVTTHSGNDTSPAKSTTSVTLNTGTPENDGPRSRGDNGAVERIGRSGSASSESSNDAVVTVSEHTTVITRRPTVRSGSITENVVETRGIRKVILETNSSNEDDDVVGRHGNSKHLHPGGLPSPAVASGQSSEGDEGHSEGVGGDAARASPTRVSGASGAAAKKKNRRKKRKGSSKA